MLFDALFGNATVEKVLLFLLVNERCYATQICHCMGGALTPIQQALQRLEKGGIITSELEGKTRLFQFNPHYPFLRELQALLKQGYQQLAIHDQQVYYCPKRGYSQRRKNKGLQDEEAFPALWNRLLQVNHLSFSARSKSDPPSGRNGVGKAKVEVKKWGTHVLVFHEQGRWVSEEGKSFDFKNVFRWTQHETKPLMTLEHLRHGPDYPVLLFELTPTSPGHFESVHPFLCNQDTYLAHLHHEHHVIRLDWRILGPRKNEEIHYIYT